MRILITSAYPPEGETGSAQVAKRLSYNFSERHQVMYLCLGKDLRVVKIKKNLWYLTIPSTNINDIWIPNINSQVVEKITEELDRFAPQVVHAHNIIFGGLLSLIWAIERNVPYVLTFHYIPSDGVGYIFPKLLQNSKIVSSINFHLTAGYITNFVKHVDLLIALNQSIVKSLKRLNIKTPYRIISNGLDLNKFYKLKVTPPHEKVMFIYVGSYMDRKNQKYLLEVFSHLPSTYILNLFGNKTSGAYYVEKLENIITEKHITNVVINDFLDQEKLLSEYQNSHYLVSASLKEVQSMVYVESLAAGHPVVALRNETIDEVINDKNGLPMPQSTPPKEFAKKLMQYVDRTRDNYLDTSAICRASVASFEMKNIILRLEEAYKYAIALKKGNNEESTEAGFYRTIKDIIPDPLKQFIPDFIKLGTKTHHVMPLKRTMFYTAVLGIIARLISIFIKRS